MCDTLCALGPATVTGKTVFAKNSDRPPDEPQDVEWYGPHDGVGSVRTTYIEVEDRGPRLGVLGSRPRWMWGFEHGINETGLAVGNEAVYTTLDPRDFPDALVGMDIVRLVLERCASVDEGVTEIAALLDRYGQGGGGHAGGARPYWSSFLLADPASAAVVETSGTDVAVEGVSDRRAISNRLTIEPFATERSVDSTLLDVLVQPRLEASQAVLAAGPASVESMKTHLRSHEGGDDGWTVCMHAGSEATTASMVAELPSDGPRVAHILLGQPCRSIYVPLVVGEPLGDVPPWERFAALSDDAPDDLSSLEAELARNVAAGVGWNAEVWRRLEPFLTAV